MKKILLATTMLVGTAGFAAAEVAMSGSASMGYKNAETALANDQEGSINHSITLSVSMSGESDAGLSFGASFDILANGSADYDADPATPATSGVLTNDGPGSVFISGAFGKLAMGDVGDADAQGGISDVGYDGIGIDDLAESLDGAGGSTVRYTYSAGALTVMASVAQTTADNRSVAVAYAGEGFGVSFGVEDNGGADNHVVVGANASVSGIALKAVYGSLGNQSQYAISATYSADALSATVFTRSSFADVQASGVGIGYDLGGGASFAAGYSKAENANGRFDAGVNFSF